MSNKIALAPKNELDTAIDVRQIAKSMIEEHGDVPTAANALQIMCEADHNIYRAVVNGHLHTLCRQLVQSQLKQERAATWAEARTCETPAPTISAEAFGAAVTRSLMDFPLLGGSRRLGDCAKVHLVTAEHGYQTQATDMQVKARWLRLIRDALPDDNTTVRQALNDDALRDLKAKALNMREAV